MFGVFLKIEGPKPLLADAGIFWHKDSHVGRVEFVIYLRIKAS